MQLEAAETALPPRDGSAVILCPCVLFRLVWVFFFFFPSTNNVPRVEGRVAGRKHGGVFLSADTSACGAMTGLNM